tara:strand:- start:559 stop:909 length:351 start_codon:yes stop_codon:yes gene_type:complete
MAEPFWDVDALLAEPEEEEGEVLSPTVVAVPSIEVVRHNLLALIQQALEGAIHTSAARDLEPSDVKVVSELMRSLKLAEDMQKDDALSQMDDETLQALAEQALTVKQLGDGEDDSD